MTGTAFLKPICLRPASILHNHHILSKSVATGHRSLSLAPLRRPITTPHPSRQHQFSTTINMLKEGDKAPAFSAEDTDGNTISSDSLSGSKVVLYFSNLAGPGCTSQSCSFRDNDARFMKLDAKVIAVSAQDKQASIAFKDANGLTFPVIPDKDKTLQKLFAVPSTLGLIPGRITYVIDREGIIRTAYNSQFSATSHIDVAIETLKTIE